MKTGPLCLCLILASCASVGPPPLPAHHPWAGYGEGSSATYRTTLTADGKETVQLTTEKLTSALPHAASLWVTTLENGKESSGSVSSGGWLLPGAEDFREIRREKIKLLGQDVPTVVEERTVKYDDGGSITETRFWSVPARIWPVRTVKEDSAVFVDIPFVGEEEIAVGDRKVMCEVYLEVVTVEGKVTQRLRYWMSRDVPGWAVRYEAHFTEFPGFESRVKKELVSFEAVR